MASMPSYVEAQSVQEKGLLENLMDFSFQRMVTPRMLKMLYSLHLLLGLIVAVGFALNGFKSSTADGLLAMVLGVGGMFLWMVYCRVVVELLAVIFRVGAAITNSQS
jgi:hypothetical protein